MTRGPSQRSIAIVVLTCVAPGCGRISFDATTAIDATGTGTDSDAQRDPSLIGYWPFDGNVATDASGNGHDAITQNVTYAPGFIGQGLSLQGANSFASVSTLNPSVFGAGSLTISLCVSVATNIGAFDMAFFMGGSNITEPGADVELGTGAWAFSIKDGAGDPDLFLRVGDDTLTGFHCVAARIDRATGMATAIRDGLAVDFDTTATLGSFTAGETLRFGSNNVDSTPMIGIVDEIRIYSRALSDDEIRALHMP